MKVELTEQQLKVILDALITQQVSLHNEVTKVAKLKQHIPTWNKLTTTLDTSCELVDYLHKLLIINKV